MPSDPCEKTPDTQFGRPRRESDAPAGLKDAQHFASGHLGAWREHVAELAQHRIEGTIIEGRRSASPSCQSMSMSAMAAFSLARWSNSSVRCWPARTSAKLTSRGAVVVVTISNGVKDAHACRRPVLNCSSAPCKSPYGSNVPRLPRLGHLV